MNKFEHLLSLSPTELADFFAEAFCAYPERNNCADLDCSACLLGWLNEKHNGSGLTEYEKIHASSLKKFAKDYASRLCQVIAPNSEACSKNSLCVLMPFKCAFEWLNSEYTERK